VCHSNDFHQIESPQVSDCQTPKEKSSCPERGIGHVGTAFAVAMTPRASRCGGHRAPPPHDQVRTNSARRIGNRQLRTWLVDQAKYYATKGRVHAIVSGLAREFRRRRDHGEYRGAVLRSTPELAKAADS
jgi:hypothetical protein